MFDEVTIVDVEHGKLVPDQRVVIVGNRIQAAGPRGAVPLPKDANVVPARGKYLIPGLWDMHIHSYYMAHWFYPLFLATGVTGVRDAGSEVPLMTLIRWRREILAGTRVGPPRQILSGPSLNTSISCGFSVTVCVDDPDRARHLVDSLKAAGADMIKPRSLSSTVYAAAVAEARHVGLAVGGHMPSEGWTAPELSDSGVSILDHMTQFGDLGARCWKPEATLEQCRPVAEHFRRNGTWWVPTLVRHVQSSGGMLKPSTEAATAHSRLGEVAARFWVSGKVPHGNWLQGSVPSALADSLRILSLARRVGIPILAGTDAEMAPSNDQLLWAMPPGLSLHVELAMLVAEGLTPLSALQAATINPAKMWHMTDSLGTVAAGKLADLVLLDADPLMDITNTTAVRAVVANGRYFDRAALDQLLIDAQFRAEGKP